MKSTKQAFFNDKIILSTKNTGRKNIRKYRDFFFFLMQANEDKFVEMKVTYQTSAQLDTSVFHHLYLLQFP